MLKNPCLYLLIASVFMSNSGCIEKNAEPSHSATIVSHVDSYGSGTGGMTLLTKSGSMLVGFNYEDLRKPDWKGNVKWNFLKREGNNDLYQVELEFTPKGGTSSSKTEQISFDGENPEKVVVNDQWIVSIEPGILSH